MHQLPIHYEPINGSVLRRAGVPETRIRRDYRRLYPDVYLHNSAEFDPIVRARAALCWSGGRGVLAGWSAAALQGVKWIDPGWPAAINLRGHARSPAGLHIYRDALTPGDVELRQSCDVTSPVRTALDLARRLPLDDGVRAVDAIYQATGLKRDHLLERLHLHPGARGIRRARTVAELSDEKSESPWETTTRLFLLRAGFPAPETQVYVYDSNGRFVARTDLGWERWRVSVEYDGDDHFDRARRNRDIERWNLLEAAGWRVIRVKARQLFRGKALLIEQIHKVLADNGARFELRPRVF